MKDKILIVEDDLDIAKLIQVHLEELDVTTEICADGKEALTKALSQDYQLIMLDVMLPGITGLDICRQVRQEKPLQAILMLTARSSEIDRVLGLELGADDYMTKPFSTRELQARVRTQLRRVHCLSNVQQRVQAATQQNTAPLNGYVNGHSNDNINTGVNNVDEAQNITCIGQLMVNHSFHQVTYQEKTLDLTSTEFDLIDFFSKHPDQVFSRAQLLDSVWGYHHSGYEHTVNSHINRLRNKLEQDSTNPQVIQTVWGVGYKLNSAGVI